MNRRIFTTILVLILFLCGVWGANCLGTAVNKIKATPTTPSSAGGKARFWRNVFLFELR